MSLNLKLSDSAANEEANALAALLNSGYIRLYDGVQPATANTPVTSQHKLAELRFGNPAFASASGGALVANPITPDNDAAATGTATWFRCFKSDGTTAIMDGSVGVSGCNMNINNPALQIGATVSLSGFTHAVTE